MFLTRPKVFTAVFKPLIHPHYTTPPRCILKILKVEPEEVHYHPIGHLINFYILA